MLLQSQLDLSMPALQRKTLHQNLVLLVTRLVYLSALSQVYLTLVR